MEEPPQEHRYSSRLLFFAALAAILLYALFYVYPADSSLVLYPIVVAPILIVVSIVSLIYVGIKKGRRRLFVLLQALFVFWLVSASLFVYEFHHEFEIRGAVRWLVSSARFKREVLARQASPNGELKNIDWDGWGMFAQDTEIYLVFDPSNSLAGPAKTQTSGRFSGLPCKVQSVRRLEDQWYSVVFYTSETWGHCN